jgi:hypothetical protein
MFVLPRFDLYAPLAIRRVRGAEAVKMLAENVFNFGRDAAAELALLAGLARRFPVWELVYGRGCDSLAETVRELLSAETRSEGERS